MKKLFFDYSIKIRGILKDDSWVGWTDGMSLIIGVRIPFTILNGENYLAIRKKDVLAELKTYYKPYDVRKEVTIVQTPAAAVVVNYLGMALYYTRLDYFEIFHRFGLRKTHTLQCDDDCIIRIYDIDHKFVGFFNTYEYHTWFDMFGINVPYSSIFKKMRRDVRDV